MATKKTPAPAPAVKPMGKPMDSRGLVRVYADVPKHVAQEFAVLAVRRDTSKRELLAGLIMAAVTGK